MEKSQLAYKTDEIAHLKYDKTFKCIIRKRMISSVKQNIAAQCLESSN